MVLPIFWNAVCITSKASARTRRSRLSRNLANAPSVKCTVAPFSSVTSPRGRSTLSSMEKALSMASIAGAAMAISCSSRVDSTWARPRIISSTIWR